MSLPTFRVSVVFPCHERVEIQDYAEAAHRLFISKSWGHRQKLALHILAIGVIPTYESHKVRDALTLDAASHQPWITQVYHSRLDSVLTDTLAVARDKSIELILALDARSVWDDKNNLTEILRHYFAERNAYKMAFEMRKLKQGRLLAVWPFSLRPIPPESIPPGADMLDNWKSRLARQYSAPAA